jgi:hypothetical protein
MTLEELPYGDFPSFDSSVDEDKLFWIPVATSLVLFLKLKSLDAVFLGDPETAESFRRTLSGALFGDQATLARGRFACEILMIVDLLHEFAELAGCFCLKTNSMQQDENWRNVCSRYP